MNLEASTDAEIAHVAFNRKDELYKIALSITNDHQLAEDAVSIAYAKILQYPNLQERHISLTVSHAAKTLFLQKNKREKYEVPLSQEVIDSQSFQPIDYLGGEELWQFVEEIFSERDLEVFRLRQTGLSSKKIGETIGIKVTSVDTIIRHFRERLTKHIWLKNLGFWKGIDSPLVQALRKKLN